MTLRWMKKLKGKVPKNDIADILSAKMTGETGRRQAAPEYSQLAYNSMLTNEFAIGNYMANE